MRYFAAILLFAFVAQSFASQELNDYLMEESDDGDRHPYVQCKIDLYDCINKGGVKKECLKAYYTCMKQLIPTVPPFVIQCKDELKSCVSAAAGLVAKGKCFVEFGKCLKNGGPVSPSSVYMMDDGSNGVDPTRHPYVQCKIDLYDCIRKKEKSKLQCLKDYRSCMAVLIPTVPPFVSECKSQLKTCLASASTLTFKAACFKDFGKCLINKGSTSAPVFDAGEYILNSIEDAPAPTRHPYLQCKIDMYKCIKEGQLGKLQCFKNYKTCMAQMIPTVPPFFGQCRDEYRKCANGTKDWKKRWQCGLDYLKCLKNKGPATAPVFDAFVENFDAPAPTSYPFVQCKKDLYKCIKGGEDKLKCYNAYKGCIKQLLPTLPPFVGQCRDEYRKCANGTKDWKKRWQCGLDYLKCLKNKGPATAPVFDAFVENFDAPAPTSYPFVQCKKDLYKCIKGGEDKLKCYNAYKVCIKQLLPTLPPFVAQCRKEYTECAAGAQDFKERLKCGVAFLKCMKKKGSSS